MTSRLTRCVNIVPVILWSFVTLAFLGQSPIFIFYPDMVSDYFSATESGSGSGAEEIGNGTDGNHNEFLIRLLGAFGLFGFAASIALASWNMKPGRRMFIITLALHLAFVAITVLFYGDTPFNDDFVTGALTISITGVALTFLQVITILGIAVCVPITASVESRSGGAVEIPVVSSSRYGGARLAEMAAMNRRV